MPDTGRKTGQGAPIGNDVTSDVAIRKAVNRAIDRRSLAAGVLEGFGRPAYFACDGLAWDNPENRIADGDPEGARRLLAAAGWRDTDDDGVRDPLGMQAYRLEVESHIITGATASIHNLVKCVQATDVGIDALVLEPLASGEAVLTDVEREMGVVLADIGGGGAVEAQLAGWQGGWTIFYWAWWISWSPFVGMFIARVSRGRSVREFIVCVLLIPSLVCVLWMTAFGGTAISQIVNDGYQAVADAPLELKLFSMLQALPLTQITSFLGIVLVVDHTAAPLLLMTGLVALFGTLYATVGVPQELQRRGYSVD